MKKLLIILGLVLILAASSVFADLGTKQECIQAIKDGLLTGSFSDGDAQAVNNAEKDFEVSLVVYYMFDNIIDNQILFDSDSGVVLAHNTLDLSVNLPECRYQFDLVCGEVLQSLNGQRYGNSKIKSGIPSPAPFCTQNEVPEFGVTTAIIALLGSLVAFFVIRKK